MIEFNGYITGDAEKRFVKKSCAFGRNILIVSMSMFWPAIIFFTITMQSWFWSAGYGLLFLIVCFTASSPLVTKNVLQCKPKRIHTEDEYIISITDKDTNYRLISDVKQVLVYDDFYELVFPFGKISDSYICQKSLLTKGTLDEFEALFENKLVKGK